MQNSIKYVYIVTSVLLLLCLLPMPYGFYTLTRIFFMLAFAWLAYKKYQSKEELLMFIFIGLAILFQPFFKFYLGRLLWNIVDIIIALGLLYLCFKRKQ